MAGYNFNNFPAFTRTSSTDQNTVTVVPLAGLDYVTIQCAAFPAWVAIWPNLDQSSFAEITADPVEISGSNERIYQCTTDASGWEALRNGMAVEIRNAANDTTRATGTIMNVGKYAPANKIENLPYRSRLTPGTSSVYTFTLVTSGSGSTIVDTDIVRPVTPAVGTGTLIPVSSGTNGLTIRVPGWAASGGLAFIAGATGTSVLTLSSLIESS